MQIKDLAKATKEYQAHVYNQYFKTLFTAEELLKILLRAEEIYKERLKEHERKRRERRKQRKLNARQNS